MFSLRQDVCSTKCPESASESSYLRETLADLWPMIRRNMLTNKLHKSHYSIFYHNRKLAGDKPLWCFSSQCLTLTLLSCFYVYKWCVIKFISTVTMFHIILLYILVTRAQRTVLFHIYPNTFDIPKYHDLLFWMLFYTDVVVVSIIAVL